MLIPCGPHLYTQSCNKYFLVRLTEVILQVSGLTDKVDKVELTVYFEDKESGGEPNAVKNCTLVPLGYAYVTFQNSYGKHTVCHRKIPIYLTW